MLGANTLLKWHILWGLSVAFFITPTAQAKSNVTFTKDEMIIDLRKGPPVIKGTIDGQIYQFLLSPGTNTLDVNPEIGERHAKTKLSLPLGIGKRTIDYRKVKVSFDRLKIEFEDGLSKRQNIYWLNKAGPPYQGFDGIINAFNFKKDKVTFILSDPKNGNIIKSKPFKSFNKSVWVQKKKKYFNDKTFALSFRPYYARTRITIGAAYAFEENNDIEYDKTVFTQPRDYVGTQEFVRARLKTPIYPLHSDRPLHDVEVHILEGSFNPIDTKISEDEVIVTGKSDRKYTKIIWLGLDFFEGCEKIEFMPRKKTMITYCV